MDGTRCLDKRMDLGRMDGYVDGMRNGGERMDHETQDQH
jgi:hypothetical protein